MTDQLDELGHELPWDRPDDARREAVRSSLLAAVADGRLPVGRRRWTVGVAFAGGVAAAAIAAIAMWPHTGAESAHLVDVEASPAAQLEHTTTRTANGDDELVRVHAGKIRIAVGNVRPGDRVHVTTGDAEIEGAASYELVAAGDRLTEVTVQSGSAVVRVRGQKAVFLAAGQSWHAAIITTDLSTGSAVRPDDSAAAGALVDNATTKSPANTDSQDSIGPHDTTARAGSSRDSASSTTDASRGTATARDATGSMDAARGPAGSAADAIARSTTSRDATGTQVGSTVSRDATSTHAGSTDAARDANGPRAGSMDLARGATTSSTPPPDPTGARAGSAVSRDATHASSTDSSRDAITTSQPPPIVLPGTHARTPTEKHFQSGWALLRAGKSADAAIELGAAADASDGELASDARYFQAVALIRAGHGGEAERSLVLFLDHAPQSVRRGRAAVMLGRLIAERGDKAAGRAWFEAALHDADPSVAAAAKAGLDGIR